MYWTSHQIFSSLILWGIFALDWITLKLFLGLKDLWFVFIKEQMLYVIVESVSVNLCVLFNFSCNNCPISCKTMHDVDSGCFLDSTPAFSWIKLNYLPWNTWLAYLLFIIILNYKINVIYILQIFKNKSILWKRTIGTILMADTLEIFSC